MRASACRVKESVKCNGDGDCYHFCRFGVKRTSSDLSLQEMYLIPWIWGPSCVVHDENEVKLSTVVATPRIEKDDFWDRRTPDCRH